MAATFLNFLGQFRLSILVFLVSVFVDEEVNAAHPGTVGAVFAAGDQVADRLIEKARSEADVFAANFAGQLRSIIDYARAKYSSALDETVEEVEGQLRYIADEVDKVNRVFAGGQAVAREILGKAGADLSVAASQLPGATRGLILGYEGGFLPPATAALGARSIIVRGNGFSEAAISCSVPEGYTCSTTVSGDGTMALGVTGEPDAHEIRSLIVEIQLETTEWLFWDKEFIYRLPVFLLPTEPVKVDLHQVTYARVESKRQPRSSDLRRLYGEQTTCNTVFTPSSGFEVDPATARVSINGANRGSAWIDTTATNKGRVVACASVQKHGFPKKDGSVEFYVHFDEVSYVEQADIAPEVLTTQQVDWSNQTTMMIPPTILTDRNYHLVVKPFWGKGIDYLEGTDDMLPVIIQPAFDKRIIALKLKPPSQIEALNGLIAD